MITRFFRTNYIGQYILTFVLSIVLWMGAFINPQPMETTNSFLYESLYNLFSPYPLLSTILAYLIVLIGAFYFNNMLYKHKLIPHNNFLPAFLCLLMASAMPSQTLSPMLLSGIFILISLNYVLDCDDMNKTTNKVFSAALMISVASLFYQVSLYFLAYLLISFLVYKIYSWREWIIIFLGYALPQIILLVYCFMTDKLTVLLDYSAHSVCQVPLSFDQYIACMHAKSLQWCPTLCYAVDCSPPGSSVRGILQARTLEWIAISFSRRSSQPGDQTGVYHIVGRSFTT